MSIEEAGLGSFFIGQEVAVPVAGGKVEFAKKGVSLQLQGTAAEKKKIHVGGLFEWKEPRLDAENQLKPEALGSQCISEVVHLGETIKVRLDLSKQNGKEYRVEVKALEVKEDIKAGS